MTIEKGKMALKIFLRNTSSRMVSLFSNKVHSFDHSVHYHGIVHKCPHCKDIIPKLQINILRKGTEGL
jgi:hypothetical protein